MILRLFLFAFCLSVLLNPASAQQKGSFSVEANYGIQGNFFVRSYDEEDSHYSKSFYNKNFLGTIGGIGIKYNFNKKSAIVLAFDKTVNSKEINYSERINGTFFVIDNFHIRHTNYFYQLGYEYSIPTKKSKWILGAGLVYARMQQQEIDISGTPPGIVLDERNYKSNGLEEGGFYAGIQHAWPIDKHFELGIRTKIFYLASVNTLESITLTPTLTYHFTGKK
jgi:hypothetical protein